MSNLITLFKIEFSKSFSMSKMKENKAKSTSFITIIAFIALLGIGLSSLYSYIYGNYFIEANESLDASAIIFALIASLLTLTSGITQTRGIFADKGYDMLASLPIRKRDIVGSKILNLYVVELIYSIIILIPNGVVNTILSNDIKYVIISVITSIFIAGIPLVLSLLLSFIITIISARFKYSNFISIILYVLFFAGIFSLSFTISSKNNAADIANIFNSIADRGKWANPTLYFVVEALESNMLFMLIYVAINVLALILVTLFISVFYDKIHEMVSAMKVDRKYVKKNLKNKKELKALLDLEYKRFFSSKLYFINSVVGLIGTLLLTIMIAIIYKNNKTDDLAKFVYQFGLGLSLLPLILVGVAPTTSSSISIEGNNFWLIKTLPINYKKYMFAKLILPLSITLPVIYISNIIILFIFNISVYAIIALFVIPTFYVLLTTFLSLIINLIFHKLKWNSEQEVIKSSASVLLSMLFDFIITFATAGILIGLTLFNEILALIVTSALLLVGALVVFIILNSIFVKRINRIEDF